MSAYLAMGGYAAFVWPAYAISLGTLATMTVLTVLAHRRALRRLKGVTAGGRPSVLS